MTISQSPISAANLAQLIELVDSGLISGKIAKTVFEEMAKSGRPPKEIVEEKGLVQMSDAATIEAIVSTVLENCTTEVEDYKNGKTKLLGFFVGQVMKATTGRANPGIVNEILRKRLDARDGSPATRHGSPDAGHQVLYIVTRRITTWILHEPEAFICKALKGEAIVHYCEPLITKQMVASGSPFG